MSGLCQYNSDCGARNAWGYWDLGYGNGKIPANNSIMVIDGFAGLSTGHVAVIIDVAINPDGTFTLHAQESNWDSDQLIDCNFSSTVVWSPSL